MKSLHQSALPKANKNRCRLICFLTCLSFLIAVISGVAFAYNKGTYRAYADEDIEDYDFDTFGTHATTEERDYFFKVMVPLVINDMVENRILASVTLAQAAMETGWGISMLARQCNNMFGIRAYSAWKGKVFNSTTKKIYANYAEGSKDSGRLWRVYDSWAESVKDHSALFNNTDIYKNLRGNWDYKFCCRELVRAGYTSNAEYAETLIYVIEHYGFTEYDNQAFAIMNGTAAPITTNPAAVTTADQTPATTAPDVQPTKTPSDYIPKDKADFIETVGHLAYEDMQKNGVLASFTIAQAIYHSKWGTATITEKSYNLFGIKALSTWGGKVYNSSTEQVYATYADAAKKSGTLWRAYDSLAESVSDRSEMFKKSTRYQNLIGNYDYKSCCQLVVEDGYASGSSYTESLISYIEEYGLTRFDSKQTAATTAQTAAVTTRAPETTVPEAPVDPIEFSDGKVFCLSGGMTEESFLSAVGKEGTITGIKGNYVGTGCVFSYNGGRFIIIVSGDVDGDGTVSASDYILIKRCCLNIAGLTGAWKDAADLDRNGTIDSTDYINVKRVILGIA